MLSKHLMLVCVLGCSGALWAADPCISGIPLGKRPGPYSFLVATGEERGQQTCYICEQEDKPTVVVFARTLTPELGQLLKQLGEITPKYQKAGFKAWMTLLTDSAQLDQLAQWSKEAGIKNLPVGAFEDVDGPPAYLISDEADVTVMLFVKRSVVHNFAFRAKALDAQAIKTIMKNVPDLMK